MPKHGRRKELALAFRTGRHRWSLVRVLEDHEGAICHDGKQCDTLREAAPLTAVPISLGLGLVAAPKHKLTRRPLPRPDLVQRMHRVQLCSKHKR
jgi:hypothetical protein